MQKGYRFSLILGAIVLAAVLGFTWSGSQAGVAPRDAPPGTLRQTEGSGRAADGALSRAARSEEADHPDTRLTQPGPSAPTPPQPMGLIWLSGHVTHEQGGPIPDAFVWARARGTHVESVEAHAFTDAQGAYRIGPLPPGLYDIAFHEPGYVFHWLPAYPLRASETLDAVLRRAAVIQGIVVDVSGHPVKNAILFLLEPTSGEVQSPPPTSRTPLSADDGTFSLETPTSGPWRVRAEHFDFLKTEVEVSSPAQDVRIALSSGAVVEVAVVDEQGRPVPEAVVTLRDVEPNDTSWFRKSRMADKRGRAALTGLVPGRYVVVAQGPEETLRAAAQPVELRAEETRRVRLQLRSGTLRLVGMAVDTRGKPLEGVMVRALPVAALEPSRQGQAGSLLGYLQEILISEWRYAPRSPVMTGPDGRFTLEHLWPGAYWVDASRRGYVLDVRATGLPVGEGADPWPRVSAGAEELRLVLAYQGLIRGRVVGPEGEPVARFSLESKPWRAEDGRFEWPVERTGRQVLRISAPGYAATVREFDVRAGEDVALGDVVLGEGRMVLVRVVDAESSGPVKGASVRLWTPAGALPSPEDPYAPTHYDETRADGTVRLWSVDAHPFELAVWHRDYVEARVPLGPEQHEVTVRLEAGAILQGWLRADGKPLTRDGRLSLHRPDGTRVSSTSVEAGWYTLHAVPRGRYIVRATCGSGCGEVFPPQLVEVPSSGTVALDLESSWHTGALELRTYERVEHVVLLAGRQPVPAEIAALRAAAAWGPRASRLEMHGGFRFERLAAGIHTLLAVRLRGNGVDVHHEEVRIPEGGSVSLELQPRWRFVGRMTGSFTEPPPVVE